MADGKTYTGGCHCGRVRYQVSADLGKVFGCNCSICMKRGALWAFTGSEQFELKAGAEELSDYQFNKKVIHHLFCRNCGVGSFSRGKAPDGRELVAINVRCLDGIDPNTLQITPIDGKNL